MRPRGGGGGCHQFMGTAAAGIYIFPLPHGSIKAILRNAIRRDITLEMEQRALSAALTWAAKCVRLKSTSCWHVRFCHSAEDKGACRHGTSMSRKSCIFVREEMSKECLSSLSSFHSIYNPPERHKHSSTWTRSFPPSFQS